jgi:hypothetical protein
MAGETCGSGRICRSKRIRSGKKFTFSERKTVHQVWFGVGVVYLASLVVFLAGCLTCFVWRSGLVWVWREEVSIGSEEGEDFVLG